MGEVPSNDAVYQHEIDTTSEKGDMPFQKRNRLGRGGSRPGAGRPSREEATFKAAVADAVGTEMKRLAEKIAKRLGARALINDKALMFVVSLAMAKAKQEIESSEVKIFRVVAAPYPAND